MKQWKRGGGIKITKRDRDFDCDCDGDYLLQIFLINCL